jgi:hypothetical protein
MLPDRREPSEGLPRRIGRPYLGDVGVGRPARRQSASYAVRRACPTVENVVRSGGRVSSTYVGKLASIKVNPIRTCWPNLRLVWSATTSRPRCRSTSFVDLRRQTCLNQSQSHTNVLAKPYVKVVGHDWPTYLGVGRPARRQSGSYAVRRACPTVENVVRSGGRVSSTYVGKLANPIRRCWPNLTLRWSAMTGRPTSVLEFRRAHVCSMTNANQSNFGRVPL